MNNETTVLTNRLVDIKYISQHSGLTDKWFYKLIQNNQFPKPIKMGRASRWLESDYLNWLDERIKQSRPNNVC